MEKFGRVVVKFRIPIIIIALVLLIPSVIGIQTTRINYDMLTYLPEGIDTVEGQNILMDEFGKGAFSFIIVEGMDDKDVSSLRQEVEQVPHVDSAIWYDSIADISVPKEFLPQKLQDVFINGDSTVIAVFFDTSSSADETIEAIEKIRDIAGEHCYVSGISALVADLKNLCEREEPIYVGMAVLCAFGAMMLLTDSWLVPLVFLAGIGITILYNLGTNVVFGEISYITKALAAVLQLAVTMDYSIFLWHSYEEQKTLRADGVPAEQMSLQQKEDAMACAINATLASVVGSSVTTMAGFLALCFMSFTLGLDLGLVMAKGVLFGVVSCVTILPAMILTFDRAIGKTRHRALLPSFRKIPRFVQRFYPLLLIIFALLWIPAVKGYFHTEVYYNLDSTLPETLPSIRANRKLSDSFHMNTTHMVLVPLDLETEKVAELSEELKQIDGIRAVIGIDALVGSEIPRELIPDQIRTMFEKGNWQMLLLMSRYRTASEEVNRQCDEISRVIRRCDSRCMLVGEAACTKDLIEITNRDFNTVNWVSIGVIAAIILLVFRSLSLPVILVAAIESAIFINMGIPYYTNTTLPFIASIVIGTIQLGSTVDYAILMTTRYRTERASGKDRKESVLIAHASSISSILVSAFSFFAATFGVGLYSEIDMISSLCTLMARGALISMVTVIFILPALLYAFDRVIIYTSAGFRPRRTGGSRPQRIPAAHAGQGGAL